MYDCMKALQSCFNAYFVQKLEYGHHILESAAEILSIVSAFTHFAVTQCLNFSFHIHNVLILPAMTAFNTEQFNSIAASSV